MRKAEITDFVKEHFLPESGRKLLYVMGEGFDFRMNIGLKSVIENCAGLDITCFLIEYDEGKTSTSRKYKNQVKENLNMLNKLLPVEKITSKKIELWSSEGKKKKRVGDQNVAEIFKDKDLFSSYTDIIVDISALPRGIYFSLIGQIQAILDNFYADTLKNFFILTAENATLDSHTKEFLPDSELSYVYGFKGGSELTSDKKQIIWLPILGEGTPHQIGAAYEKIKPNEICPVLPFPSQNPRRSDALLIEYHQLLFDELNIEGQNIIYVPEQNPFEVYRTLSQTIRDYNETLAVVKGCDIVISTFSSKLLSIGALLCAYEFKAASDIKVGILNVDSSGYEIDPAALDNNLVNRSELFLIWLAGEPYNK